MVCKNYSIPCPLTSDFRTIDNTPITSIVVDLCDLGFAVAEVEYRRRDDEGGGWPGTNLDGVEALNALPHVCQEHALHLDLDRVMLVGHSAGGALVLWLGEQELRVNVRLIVAVAPVTDLEDGYRRRLSDEGDAIELYMKCTPDTAEGLREYSKASPIRLLPARRNILLVVGSEDRDVPADMIEKYYQKAAKEKQDSDLLLQIVKIPEADHYDILSRGHLAWKKVKDGIVEIWKACTEL
ncbi:hypothetical protein GUITHDRAFT_132065 [Guillardia theta CCMP2712]|uniref:Peptidase S9 prolyl oligopeptidase catalytic domain-containing protein n=1 Tax=Guillardia theta (strain CCMP2712) TaxID=905079 RepID=L1K1T6_GUITC|nr:hypothetical protein GUITHDRAFT_132065 [Guillardia theta CCMP2712]EKX54313.1 hypothetical protein GUITHDRAFT_132065 [Guillardia theta CCMP2712]|eukprot:XP_005841293.1 hypothetical protein GUITHDRAFT_132065 [Guillardia theta CCMP2712]